MRRWHVSSNNLDDGKKLEYQIADIQNLPFEDESFDIVIANMMLYHVPNLDKGLKEVRRVLKEGGSFYCATYGENNFTDEIITWLNVEDKEFRPKHSFTLQNGIEILSKSFSQIDKLHYEDSLHVTEIKDMVEYIKSLPSINMNSKISYERIREIVTSHAVDGVIDLPKDYGMFVCC